MQTLKFYDLHLVSNKIEFKLILRNSHSFSSLIFISIWTYFDFPAVSHVFTAEPKWISRQKRLFLFCPNGEMKELTVVGHQKLQKIGREWRVATSLPLHSIFASLGRGFRIPNHHLQRIAICTFRHFATSSIIPTTSWEDSLFRFFIPAKYVLCNRRKSQQSIVN